MWLVFVVVRAAGLGETRIRDLNDAINKLLREKRHWERRIVELGGANYRRRAPTSFEAEGVALSAGGNYLYFGAAKDLPGVRELFAEADEPDAKHKLRRRDILKRLTPDYYGFRDEDDGALVGLEAAAEKRGTRAELAPWQ